MYGLGAWMNDFAHQYFPPLQVIYIPTPVIKTCLLLGSSLSTAELEKCKHFATRSYNAFKTPIKVNPLTGANALDIAQLGIDQALLTANTTLLTDAYRNARGELKIMNAVRADGIRGDGAFGAYLVPRLEVC